MVYPNTFTQFAEEIYEDLTAGSEALDLETVKAFVKAMQTRIYEDKVDKTSTLIWGELETEFRRVFLELI